MHGITRCPPGLSVQVVALHEHRVIAETAQPHVSLATQIQLDAFADMQPRPLTLLSTMNVAEGAQAKAVAAGRVYVAINDHVRLTRRHLKRLSHLSIQLKVRNATPVLGRWLSRETGHWQVA